MDWRLRNASGCHLEKQRGCSRISPYLNSGIARFSICTRYSRVKLETMPIGSPFSMSGGSTLRGRAACAVKRFPLTKGLATFSFVDAQMPN